MAAKALYPSLQITRSNVLGHLHSYKLLTNHQCVQVRTRWKYPAPPYNYDVGRKSYADMDLSTWDGEQFVVQTKHPEASRVYPGLYSGTPPPVGKIYDRKPFRFEVKAGKVYKWCSCGASKTQPFCDKSHMYEEGNSFVKKNPRFRPVKYVPKETKTVYFCNCKQTKNRPFCDNTHKEDFVQEGISIVRDMKHVKEIPKS